MKVTRFKDAPRYDAPRHHGFIGLRLQGFDADGPKNQWVGISHFLPGGGAEPESSPWEKVYVCLAGAISVVINGEEILLNTMDSMTVAPNEAREIINRGNDVATTLVVMPYPPA